MIYFLMHKNDKVAIIEFDSSGNVTNIGNSYRKELLPYPAQKDIFYLREWIHSRAIPKTRHGIKNVLRTLRLPNTTSLLLDNLGLSLNDCYWLNPADIQYTWEEVNLFANPFSEAFFVDDNSKMLNQTKFSPNASLQGELKKKWVINTDNERVLLKGNYGSNWQQSLNEFLASEINSRQPRCPGYTEYQLKKGSVGDDDEEAIICSSVNFIKTDEEEFIPIWDIYQSAKWRGDTSRYHTIVNRCVELGLDEEYATKFFSYQILLDFIITNTDRHFNNFGIIRDTNTLKPLRFAPIYDCGNSMFWDKHDLPVTEKALTSIKTISFLDKEIAMLRYVNDFELLDCNLLPSKSEFFEIYEKDPNMSKERIEKLYNIVNRKVNMLEQIKNKNNRLKTLNVF